MANISEIRTPYNDRENLFLEENIKIREPFTLFTEWFKEAQRNKLIKEANAACLATATKQGVPSARFILCKEYDKEGFSFYTHYTSRKGQELEANPHAALTFYWPPFSRSVRIEGIVEKLPFSKADDYFKTRPYQSQIGALCSNQSVPIESRDVLFDKERELKDLYKEQVPRPELWGGYKLIPSSIEFWQGQSDRIHDRIRFRKLKVDEEPDERLVHEGEDGWVYERLAP